MGKGGGRGMPAFKNESRFTPAVFILLLSFLGSLPVPAAAQKVALVDVGVIVPKDVISGEVISATMTPNPKDLAGLASLQVLPLQIPGIPGVNGADLLNKYKVQAGDAANFVPAGGPFSFKAASTVQVKITRADLDNAPVTTARILMPLGSALTSDPGCPALAGTSTRSGYPLCPGPASNTTAVGHIRAHEGDRFPDGQTS
jgi:hypothetical protein